MSTVRNQTFVTVILSRAKDPNGRRTVVLSLGSFGLLGMAGQVQCDFYPCSSV